MRWSHAVRQIATACVVLTLVLYTLSYNGHGIKEAKQFFRPRPGNEIPLGQVLQDLVNAPLLSYEESVKLSSATCPTEGVNFDAGAVNGNAQKWSEIPITKISDWRHDIAAHLEMRERVEQEREAAGVQEGTGRGIVMAAGNRDAVIRAGVNIRFLRSYNCSLDVEIFHFEGELDEGDKTLLLGLAQIPVFDADGKNVSDVKVTVRTVADIKKGSGWKAFEIKAAAIQQSSFDEILYLDTDSYLLRNPEYLFEGKHFEDTGLLLWPDYTKSHPSNPLWRILGQPCRNEYEGESGQIVVSRSQHQDVLWLAEYFALHHTDFYGFMGGDRDSFRAAALLLGKRWSGPGRLNAAAGVVLKGSGKLNTAAGVVTQGKPGGGHTMLQADPEGRWTFVHANLIKHGKFPTPLWHRIQRAANDKFAEGTTYGNISPPNDKLGDGVKLRVDQAPKLITTMETFDGYDEGLVVMEEWDTYEELKGFEEKWFRFGGKH